MKSRETKQNDLNALTDSLQNSTSAMVVSFSKLSVTKDQEFRNHLREAGARYQVVKNTLAKIAVKGTQFEEATESFKGVSGIAWTDGDAVVLSKAVSKFIKDNANMYTFKSGVVDGRLVNLEQLTTIANLPSKEELISKLLFVLNAQAQRIVTVINAVPRDLAVVIKQIGEQEGRAARAPVADAAPAAESAADNTSAGEPSAVEAASADEAPAGEAEIAAPPENASPVDAEAVLEETPTGDDAAAQPVEK